MSKVVLILLVTSVGLGLTSLHLVKQLRAGEAAIAALKAEVASLQEQAAAAPKFTAPPTALVTGGVESPGNAASAAAPAPSEEFPSEELKESKQPPSRNAAPQMTATVSVPPSPPLREDRVRMMREYRERQRQLMQDPEYREAMRLQSRSGLARQYPGVVQELGFDQQQAEAFFDMLADQQLRSSEQMEPLWEPQAGAADPAALQERQRKVQQAVTEMQRNNEAELASRFGQDKLQAWKEYQSTVGMRHQLEQMRSTLSAQGLPLSEDVSRPMLKALAAAQKTEMDEYAAVASRGAAPALAANGVHNVAFEPGNMEQQIEMAKQRNQRRLDAISPYLTFEQRSAIEREQDAQLKMLEAQMRLMRARGTPNSNGFHTDGVAQFIAIPR